MNTSGMLETRYMCSRHGTYPCTWVKQDIPDSRPIEICPKVASQIKDQNLHTINYAQYNRKLDAGQFCGKAVFPFAVRQGCAVNYLRVEDLP